MIPPVFAVRRVLLDNVKYNGKTIPVRLRSYPYDETPCITVDDSGGSIFINRDITNEDYPLPNTHPQFDAESPFKKYPQQVLREVSTTTLNINVWCDNNPLQREELVKQVSLLFHQAQADYYKFCDNYRDGECAGCGGPCIVELSSSDKRGVKGQCPQPYLYGYKNIFTTYNLIRDSFFVDQPFSLDDLSETEPVLRSVFKLTTGYYVDHIIGGHVSTDLKADANVI